MATVVEAITNTKALIERQTSELKIVNGSVTVWQSADDN